MVRALLVLNEFKRKVVMILTLLISVVSVNFQLVNDVS